MKNLSEIKITPEIMKKIESCHSAEELVKLAGENGVQLSLQEAEQYFNKDIVSMSDEEMDKVIGGVSAAATNIIGNVFDKNGILKLK